MALKKDGRFPFAPPDELHPEEPKKGEKKDGSSSKAYAEKSDKKSKDGGKAKASDTATPPKPVVIDLEGLSARLYKVPIPAGRLDALRTDGQRLYR